MLSVFAKLFGAMRPLTNLHSWKLYIYFIVIIACMNLFQQGDLGHTATSSYAYLNGHLSDFYDYNKHYMERNDYLPLLYIIFALWNIPLHALGFTTSPEALTGFLGSPIEVLWWKMLLAIFFFATLTIINKISALVDIDQSKLSSLPSLVFATSPIVIFAVFIFSGYDIISVFFTLTGFYFYLKKDLSKFILFFSVAISFKFFALFIYLPLVLIAEKRLFHIIKLMLLGLLVTLIELLIYWNSEVFRREIFELALVKSHGSFSSYHGLITVLMGLIYLGGCFYLHIKKFDVDVEWKRVVVLTPLIAYSLMFASVPWHPQWLVIIFPFSALSYLYVRNKNLLLILDVLGMFAFVWYIINQYPLNVDVAMITKGVLKSVLPHPLLINSDLMPGGKLLAVCIFMIYLFSPIILIIYESLNKLKVKQRNVSENLIFYRFILGLSFFVIPCLICLFIPIEWAVKINPMAYIGRL